MVNDNKLQVITLALTDDYGEHEGEPDEMMATRSIRRHGIHLPEVAANI